jgi:DNA repair photolyase
MRKNQPTKNVGVKQSDLFTSAPSESSAVARSCMNGKPVFEIPAKTIINFESGFKPKLLCDGPVFNLGSACVYSCDFCYVPDMSDKQRPYFEKHGITGKHEDIVIRRAGAIARLRAELTDRSGRPKFKTADDRRMIYSSTSVDVAGTMELVRETIEACKIILDMTNWQIRLLSKSNLLPKIAQELSTYRDRMIYGVSTGTLDDDLARVFEKGTPLVSKRIASLHWLQDNGFRTFGMICPSLPQTDYYKWARQMHAAIRSNANQCLNGEPYVSMSMTFCVTPGWSRIRTLSIFNRPFFGFTSTPQYWTPANSRRSTPHSRPLAWQQSSTRIG